MHQKRTRTNQSNEKPGKRPKAGEWTSTKSVIDCDGLEDDMGDIERVAGLQMREGEVRTMATGATECE